MRTYLMIFFLGSYQIMNAQTTSALPLPIDMHYVYLNTYGQHCNYGVNLVESDLGPNGLPGVTYYTEEAVPLLYCPNEIVCEPTTNIYSVLSQVGNKWYRNNNLWFDWDNQVGDTCQLEYLNNLSDCIIVNIDTLIFADGISRRQYHIVEATSGSDLIIDGSFVPFTFIEGIGTNNMGLEYQTIETNQYLSCVYDKNGLQLIQNDLTSHLATSCCTANSVNEFANSTFSIFPSPAIDQTSLQFESAHIPQDIQIFNATGQLMHTEKVLGRLQMQVNISNFATGIYIVRASFENGEEVNERLVVE
jgi:hypothetical protein